MNILVLGASSAIASEISRQFATRGDTLLLVGRDPARLQETANDLLVRGAARVEIHACDLAKTDQEAAMTAFQTTLRTIDVVILAYGLLGDQREAETDLAAAGKLLETNFTSAALWLLAAANIVSPKGEIVSISSVAGDRGRQSNYIYGAAKGALSIMGQGMAHRFTGKGPGILTVKCGFVDTPMTVAFQKGPLWAKPEAVARTIIAAIDDRRNGAIYVPGFWRWIMLIIRLVPTPVFHRTKL